jgi:hypothetical protein
MTPNSVTVQVAQPSPFDGEPLDRRGVVFVFWNEERDEDVDVEHADHVRPSR